VAATNMQTIPFPGIPGGIPYAVSFTIPTIDLFPPDSATEALPPGPDQLSIHTNVRITLGCMHWSQNPTGDREPPPALAPVSVTLSVWALASVDSQYFGPGTGFISFTVIRVLLPDVLPAGLANVLDCMIRMMLQAALSNVQLPFHALSAGAFELILQQGPEIADNQIEAWGDV
jgi:hypothetical protein